ncbi:hypothetical protein Q0590_31540 [Rhodocytophaga aerolata]|uniref:Uncharacterized protein n=1 Tax=Rhodocytophaga aerolata TaxID=455078 RepID=A0ABT8RJ25_9BACT|nr:hypothetical protein [Rhodocytophaga aerolata]MDO1450850.1 hypothetical protein [Rhodocytophaga aerolata]
MEIEQIEQTLTIAKGSTLSNDVGGQELFLTTLFESARKLDPSILEPLIDEEGSFEDGTKYLFLSQLKQVYNMVGLKDQMETVLEQQAACVGEASCRFKDGVATKGMKVQGFRCFSKPMKSRFSIELQPRYNPAFCFLLALYSATSSMFFPTSCCAGV